MTDRTARDHRLVERVRQGDHDAFGTLVGHYQRLVASVAWRYGTPPSAIDDVVSEVFLKTYSRLEQFQPNHAFSTWLYRLAVNHVIDRSRRQRRDPAQEELPSDVESAAPGPADEIESVERRRLLHAALQTLSPHFREVVFLVYIEGMSVKEAATMLGLPEGTIKTRLMRGRDALRVRLSRRHPEYFGELT
ncbi:MAG: sigma-70 family RNA polymerase sigma factor [Acidobacteriota bacterium]|nr:sigma-70 family RNA polymerase sigma factor [Acidobacteriota bacterium]MDH3784818.1 sigma-70 family RNA polymerase sigma factor [Acidobacteriota bacterium]